jgi:hypothetical protein
MECEPAKSANKIIYVAPWSMFYVSYMCGDIGW